MTTLSTEAPRRYPGRMLLALGLLLPVVGVAGYVAQVAAHRLITPWYMPVAATLGAVLLIAALARRFTVWRIIALLLVTLFAGAEWMFLLGARLPAYAGPVAAGQPFPAFTTARADGTPFTRADLEGDPNNVMVFFRGRW